LESDITLRLLDPTIMLAGIALVAMAVSAFTVALRLRIKHLHIAAASLLIAALPWLAVGIVDTLVWFGLASSETYPPSSLAIVARLRRYLLLFAACSIALATFRHLPLSGRADR
jgi:hypothetical protein